MKLFVISLKQAKSRRVHIRHVMEAQSLNFEWFEAVDGSDIGSYPSISEQEYRFSENLLAGKIGCFLSHIMCWQNILSKGLDQAIILEDDIVLGDNATRFLDNTDWLPEEFDLIKVDTHLSSCPLKSTKPIQIDNNRKLYELLDTHHCTGGYVISARGARRLLGSVKSGVIDLPVDDFMYSSQKANPHRAALQTYQMAPALCIQVGTLYNDQSIFPSYIQKKQVPIKQRKTLSQKIRRETLRIFLKSFQLINDRVHKVIRVIVPFR